MQAHGGMRSLEAALRTPRFLQLRLGVGRVPPGGAMVEHVLGRFAGGELARLPELYAAAGEAMLWLLAAELDSAAALDYARHYLNQQRRFDIA